MEFSERLAIKALIAFSILFIVSVVVVFMPPDMDIFQPYSPIACRYYPLAVFHSFREPCNGHSDLNLFGGLTWMRSTWNQGTSEALLYLPIYLLFPFWQSVVIMGILWQLLIVYIFVRISGVSPWVAALVFGVNFYFMYNYLYAYENGMQTAALFAIPLLVRRIFTSGSTSAKLGWNIVLGCVVFFAWEFKATFSYYLPGAMILTLYFNRDLLPIKLASITLFVRRCLPGMLLTLALVVWLLTATLAGGNTMYWEQFRYLPDHYPLYNSVEPYLVHSWQLFTRYILHFPNSAAIVYGSQGLALLNSPLDYKGILITLPFWLVFGVLGFKFYRLRGVDPVLAADHRAKIKGLFLTAMLMFFFISMQTQSRHAFHLAPIMLCVLGCMAMCIDYLKRIGKPSNAWLLVLIASQIGCTCYVASQKPLSGFAWERFPTIAYTKKPEIAEHAVIVNLNWGTYYISSLYGPKKQLVTYNEPINNGEIDRLIKIANDNGRYLIFITKPESKDYLETLKARFPNIQKVFPPAGVNSDWEVLVEPDKIIK